MNADGTNQTLVLETDGVFDISGADWSPDGSMLVFWYQGGGQGPGIYTVGVDVVDDVVVVTEPGKVIGTNSVSWPGEPVWSPLPVPGDFGQGQYRIAYQDEITPGYYEIFLVSPDGSDPVQLTDTPFGVGGPTWSPSATKLAFCVSASDGGAPGDMPTWGLYDFVEETCTIREHVGPLAEEPRWVSCPAWAKTQEDKIAWNCNSDIWVLDLDDLSNPTNLTNTPDSHEAYNSWSPDDTEIVFDNNPLSGKTKGKPNPVIDRGYTIMSALDGSDRRRIADGGGIIVWRR
jgi:Tol biopolymer transport system component